MAGALTLGTEVQGSEAQEESEFFNARYKPAMTAEKMCAALKAETGKTFYVGNEADGKVKLKSETADWIVWWNSIPETVLAKAGGLLIWLRFDSFGTDGAGKERGYKYHFHVVDKVNPNGYGSDAVCSGLFETQIQSFILIQKHHRRILI